MESSKSYENYARSFKYDNKLKLEVSSNTFKTEFDMVNIFSNMKQNQFLLNQEYNNEYLSNRSYLINIINTLNRKLRFKIQTFYIAVNYMDIILNKEEKFDKNSDSIAICCLIVAAKFQENDPDIPNMSYFLTLLHKYYPLEVMKKLEVYILKSLDYRLNYYNIFHFVLFFINNGALQYENNNYNFENDLINKDEVYLEKDLAELVCYICENVLMNKLFIGYDNEKLACSIIFYIREINNFSPFWPIKFEKIFNIKSNDFSSDYEKLKIYINITDKKNNFEEINKYNCHETLSNDNKLEVIKPENKNTSKENCELIKEVGTIRDNIKEKLKKFYLLYQKPRSFSANKDNENNEQSKYINQEIYSKSNVKDKKESKNITYAESSEFSNLKYDLNDKFIKYDNLEKCSNILDKTKKLFHKENKHSNDYKSQGNTIIINNNININNYITKNYYYPDIDYKYNDNDKLYTKYLSKNERYDLYKVKKDDYEILNDRYDYSNINNYPQKSYNDRLTKSNGNNSSYKYENYDYLKKYKKGGLY